MEKTHWLRFHCGRRISLDGVITGMDSSIEKIYHQISVIEWYDMGFYLEESEPIIGLGFIAYQNYINSSIYDKFETQVGKVEHYKKGEIIEGTNRTEVELIICLANYYKHRDDDNPLHGGTSSVLNEFGFKYGNEFDVFESPLIKGLEVLSVNYKLSEISQKVYDWRELLWTS